MSSPAWIWNVSYSAVEDLDNGVRNLLDGELHIWPAKRWIVLVDVEGSRIIGKFMRKDDEVLEVGSVVEFSVFHALVDHCILSPPEPQSGMVKVQMNDIAKTLDLASLVRSWKITYSTTKDLDRGHMKAYDGSLCYCMDKYLRLFNAKSALIGCQKVSSSDLFHVGAKIRFTGYVVRMGKLIKSNPAVDDISVKDTAPGDESDGLNKDKAVVNPLETLLAQGSATQSDQATPTSSSFVHAALFKDLDFSHGINFAKDVKNKFNKEMSSPNSVNALVQHGQYQIQNRLLRFVHVGEAPQNHRAALGFRRGWLMFLGVHLDYRNDFDIAQAVATFGQFHTWNSNDPVKDRVLVYASFPSPQLVPRDVVFERFATVGGAKESWTALVYILTAEFAEALPADEDQMPPDGNPHPFPGELQPNNNIFVNPQFPEIGWDAVQDFGHEQQGNQGGHHGQQGGWGLMNNEQQGAWEHGEEVQQVVLHDIQESMVINLSDSSGSSVNMMEVQHQPQEDGLQMLHNVLNIGMVHTVYGPALPPEMVCAQALQLALPSWLSKHVPKACLSAPFAFLKKLFGAGSVLELRRGGKHLECFIDTSMLQVSLPVGDSERRVEEVADLQGGLQQEAPISRPKKGEQRPLHL
ncbi:hypothetical protein ACQ4PT_052440 [Festuca glaucescens]